MPVSVRKVRSETFTKNGLKFKRGFCLVWWHFLDLRGITVVEKNRVDLFAHSRFVIMMMSHLLYHMCLVALWGMLFCTLENIIRTFFCENPASIDRSSHSSIHLLQCWQTWQVPFSSRFKNCMSGEWTSILFSTCPPPPLSVHLGFFC